MRMYSTSTGRGGRRFRPVLDRAPVALSGAAALVAGVALAFGLSCLGELRDGWFALAAFAALCALLGAGSRPWAAPVIGGAAWLFYNGFAEHSYGELGWSGVELVRLALLVLAAAAGTVPAAVPRRTVRAQPVAPVRPGRGEWPRARGRNAPDD
ncbi:hypothetical protein [Kitasatospora camelliae]|uniref:Histidine kinase n=1 Tax=Kitasatospora camelliae TaxID=3156397 RepID=A0AAU8K5V1_9ACTN